jgi:hypothetical protein
MSQQGLDVRRPQQQEQQQQHHSRRRRHVVDVVVGGESGVVAGRAWSLLKLRNYVAIWTILQHLWVCHSPFQFVAAFSDLHSTRTTLLSSSSSSSLSRYRSILHDVVPVRTRMLPRTRSTIPPILAATNNNNDDETGNVINDDDDEKIKNTTNDDGNGQERIRWDKEETLLVMKLSPLPGKGVIECYDRVCQYTQGFPFAAVLPVQPLQYLPTIDGGVDVTFLRKKTDMKSGIDGGIRFFITTTTSAATITPGKTSSDDEDIAAATTDDDNHDTVGGGVINIVAKRNSSGQSISKIFSEKIAIVTYVRSLTEASEVSQRLRRRDGNDDVNDSAGFDNNENSSSSSTGSAIKIPQTRVIAPTTDLAVVDSLFHKWM